MACQPQGSRLAETLRWKGPIAAAIRAPQAERHRERRFVLKSTGGTLPPCMLQASRPREGQRTRKQDACVPGRNRNGVDALASPAGFEPTLPP